MRITHVLCCDYHAGPRDDPFHRRQAYSFRYGDGPYPISAAIKVPRNLDDVVAAVDEALKHDHPCEDPTCDIAAALEADCTTAAFHMLTSATEPEAIDRLVCALTFTYGENAVEQALGVDLYSCPDWEDWEKHHKQYGHKCEACGSYTYADPWWEPERCGQCNARLEVSNDDDD